MAKDPAFLFYPGDFNTGTQFFTDEQVGKYMRLLMAQHQHGHLTENQVIIICKSYDKDVMSKFKKDDKGLWYNERLESEVIKRKNFVLSRSKNKLGKGKEKNISFSYDNHMENKNENVIGINTLVDNSEIVDEWTFWGKQIVNGNDPIWDQIRGRKVTQDEMDIFLSVATRCGWKMETQQTFRISLKGFKTKDYEKQLKQDKTKFVA